MPVFLFFEILLSFLAIVFVSGCSGLKVFLYLFDAWFAEQQDVLIFLTFTFGLTRGLLRGTRVSICSTKDFEQIREDVWFMSVPKMMHIAAYLPPTKHS